MDKSSENHTPEAQTPAMEIPTEPTRRGRKGKFRPILIRDTKYLPTDPALKKYKTFTNSSKHLILNDMKKRVMPYSEHEFEHKKDSKELIRALGKLDLNDYNNLLTEVLGRHLGSFNPSTKNLTLWRRKMKNWLQNINKPEKRGGVLVSDDKFDKFRVKLVEILTSMPYRVFSTLRERILVVLEEVYNQEQEEAGRKCYKPFNRNTCSKHWWFNFQRRYPEIKRLWERLPLERSTNKLPKPDGSPDENHVMPDPVFKKFISETKCETDSMKKEVIPLTLPSQSVFMPQFNFDPTMLTSLIVNQLNFSELIKKEPMTMDTESTTHIKSETDIKAEPFFEIPPPIGNSLIQPTKVLQPIQKPIPITPTNQPIAITPAKVPYIHDIEEDAPIIQPPIVQKTVEAEKPQPQAPKSATELAKEQFSPQLLAKINEAVMQVLLAHKDKIVDAESSGASNDIIQSVVQATARGTIVEERVVTTETKTVYRTIYEPKEDAVKAEEH